MRIKPSCLGILLVFALLQGSTSVPCSPRSFGTNKIVCVCNATYCDTVDELGVVSPGTGVLYTSSQAGLRVQRQVVKATQTFGNTQFTLDTSTTYQTIKGFGSCFTDSVGINLNSLTKPLRDSIMTGYFGPNSIGYTIARVPIASTDCSTHEYSYDDVPGDLNLVNFNLTVEDFTLKIPYIKQAMQLVGQDLKLFCSPWSAPGWMKSNGDMKGGGTLKGDVNGPYYRTWANYLMKFLNAYHTQGVDFWGITLQNEPTSGLIPDYGWQTMYFSAAMQRDFIKGLVGPALKSSSVTSNINVMIMDDQRFSLPLWPNTILSDPDAAKYVSGIAVHWYEDQETPPGVINTTNSNWPNYWILNTEASTGYEPGQGSPILGSWNRGQQYAHDMITDINNFITGWVDWNFCLDMQGGPNWVQNYVDAPIIVNSAQQEYYKQPMWYTMAHFSKFMRPGSLRVKVAATSVPTTAEYTAFSTPDGNKGIIISNKGPGEFTASVTDKKNLQNLYSIKVPGNSLVTFVFN